MHNLAPTSPTKSALSTTGFRIGDLVRVKAARRRDVIFAVCEVTPTHVRATNDRGGEAIYLAAPFEHEAALSAESGSRPGRQKQIGDGNGTNPCCYKPLLTTIAKLWGGSPLTASPRTNVSWSTMGFAEAIVDKGPQTSVRQRSRG
jgi:hypothetical protein